VEAFTTRAATLLGAGEPREIEVASVSDGLVDLLALPVALGRTFAPGENEPGRGALLVLSHGFWMRELGGARDVLGRTLVVNGRPCLVVGVLAPGAGLTEPADAYMPLEYNDTFSATTATNRRGEFLTVLGRARPGVSAAQVTDDVRRVGAQLQRTFPDTNGGLTFSAAPLRETLVGDVREPLLVLFGAVAFVLLVACANVANLLLARASTRQSEMAVRAALGASRARLLRQLVTESAVLAAIGGGIGLALTFGLTRALVAARPADIPRLDEVGVDAAVLAFTLGLVLLTSLLVALLPALQATGARLTRALSAGGRGQGRGSSGQRLRAGLIVAEITLAVVLLMGAGLFVRSFIERTRVDPGFKAAGAMSFRVSMQGDAYGERPAIVQRVDDIEARIRTLPGVTAVGATTTLPLSGRGNLVGFGVEGAPPSPPDVNDEIGLASVTPGYFEAIGARLRRGRLFSERDTANAPRVAVANEAAVRFWLSDRDPIGRRVNINGTPYEVVGVVADVRQRGAGERVMPQLYAPYAQRATRSVRLVVRSAGDPSLLGPSIRSAIRALDANLPIEGFAPLERLLAGSVARPRFYTALLTLFAAVGLALASTGIFGVMSYTVAERTREISIRLALGAQVGDVRRLVAGRVLLLTGAGLVVGLAGALALGRAIETQLFGVGRLDPLTLAGVIVVLGSSAIAASLLPLRRATRLDPARALRES
jgi:putative ABC transport system permease protein